MKFTVLNSSRANRTITVTEEDWTETDATEAASLLQAHEEKCLITNILEELEEDSWNRFYHSHQTNFYKDKHYLETDFSDEFSVTTINPTRARCCVEIGCGVGNAVLPLLDQRVDDNGDGAAAIDWTIHCMDLSPVAVELLQQDARFKQAHEMNRAFAYVCNITKQIPEPCIHAATVTTLFFCLSAIDPMLHAAAARNIAHSLAHGGVLVIRDYGRYDEGQLKLGLQRHKLVKSNFYRKFDGTKCYYFTLDDLRQLFEQDCGLEVLELRYLCKVFENRSQQSKRRRVWVSARFRKPFEVAD
ncbi:hypothetical protein MPSEU_000820400 [Mayamaea pseudoterrestris]|nr:hypothetical protein MPSEU_000820400 [Mayamaea pseudoterrestris]